MDMWESGKNTIQDRRISIKMMVKQTMSGDSPAHWAHWDIFASHTSDSLIKASTTTFQDYGPGGSEV
jgi:hypothetical protein